MEKIAAFLGVVLSLVSVGSAFETFTTIGLLPKLIVTAAAALLVVLSIAHWLAKYVTPDNGFIGGGQPAPERSIRRYLAFTPLLAVFCVLFIYLGLFLTQRFALQLSDATEAGKSATRLMAPDADVESVTIELPGKADATCDWTNRSRADLPPLSVQMIGWDSPTPQLHIDHFVYPQGVEIDCKPPRSIHSGITVPPRTVIYPADTLRTIRITIIAVGVLLWLTACFVTWRWSA